MNSSLASREFRLDPQYVRCGFYVVAGFLLIGGVAVWLGRAVGGRAPGPGPQFALYAAIAALGLLPFRWRLAVDKQGIWRRRVVRWELWSWDDFASGRLKYGFYDRSVVDPARRWWQRTLDLGSLAEADREQVWKWIQLVWQPPTVACPDELRFSYGSAWNTPVAMNAAEIRIGREGRREVYAWRDAQLELHRLRHDRPDFHRLELRLASKKTIRLHRIVDNGVELRNWKNVEIEELAAFLLAHVPAEQQLLVAMCAKPCTAVELERRLQKSAKDLKDWYWVQMLLLGSMAALIVYALFARDWRFALALSGGVLVPFLALCRFIHRDMRKHREGLLNATEELERQAGAGAAPQSSDYNGPQAR